MERKGTAAGIGIEPDGAWGLTGEDSQERTMLLPSPAGQRPVPLYQEAGLFGVGAARWP